MSDFDAAIHYTSIQTAIVLPLGRVTIPSTEPAGHPVAGLGMMLLAAIV